MKLFIIKILTILLIFIPYGYSGVTKDLHENHQKLPQSPQQIEGLYDENDKVVALNGDNFNKMIIDKDHSTLLEFYNSYCGHCRRFAPIYKKLAIDMWPWRDIIKVMAIDCANDENNDICRKYEVMAYPSLRYFSPHYKDYDNNNNLGVSIYGQHPDYIKSFIIHALLNETILNNNNMYNRSSAIDKWPDFKLMTSLKSINTLFNNLPNDVQYIFIIYEPSNSSIGNHIILDFHRLKKIRVLHIVSSDIAKLLNLETYNQIAIIDRNFNLDKLTIPNINIENYQTILKQFLKNKNLYNEIDYDNDENENEQNNNKNILQNNDNNKTNNNNLNNQFKNFNTIKERNNAILNEVKKNKHIVYQSDLENALRYSLFHEITKFTDIDGEKLLALQRYINVLVRYNPLGENGQKFLQKLREYILQNNQIIHGINLLQKLIIYEKEFSPIFSSSHWIGCQPSKPGLRGFTCGLWQLFHFMTVQAAENEKITDPLEVLQAMHGYVKYFFGCSDCSNHFQTMAAKNKIWNTSSKDNAILWLWSAHNEVNKRLASDETEDPEFPKIQFPSRDSCPECYKEQSTSPIINVNNLNDNINWDRTEILLFLKRIHNPQNISRFGIDDESVLPPTAEKLREKRLLGNMFSDLDMRMGIFLYIFCIGMMVIAVKLFLRKGYRKKVYSHDFLGKV